MEPFFSVYKYQVSPLFSRKLLSFVQTTSLQDVKERPTFQGQFLQSKIEMKHLIIAIKEPTTETLNGKNIYIVLLFMSQLI